MCPPPSLRQLSFKSLEVDLENVEQLDYFSGWWLRSATERGNPVITLRIQAAVASLADKLLGPAAAGEIDRRLSKTLNDLWTSVIPWDFPRMDIVVSTDHELPRSQDAVRDKLRLDTLRRNISVGTSTFAQWKVEFRGKFSDVISFP